MATKKRGLGRGLDALLGGSEKKELQYINLELIQRGQYQPRRDMDLVALDELAQSIKNYGVMQPIVVRPIAQEKFEIVAGERRWQASQQAGLINIPAMVRELSDEKTIAMALIENIQREDLNPIEEAVSLQRLQKEFELTQQQVADTVGKSRSAVANLLRLVSLPSEVKNMLSYGDIEMGHARALLSLPDNQQLIIAKQVAAQSLTVRQTEALVQRILKQKNDIQKTSKKDPDIVQLENRLAECLGSPVTIKHSSKGKGQVVICYSSLNELQGVLKHIR
ncbi:UNVERIFIED_CONTAM: hypothetical protein GTU68_008222 [Idotea baltica]|nr:hypothetical protein [Idotea baltica]